METVLRLMCLVSLTQVSILDALVTFLLSVDATPDFFSHFQVPLFKKSWLQITTWYQCRVGLQSACMTAYGENLCTPTATNTY
jgi:hypothetical protein